jgi:hypothetical protein
MDYVALCHNRSVYLSPMPIAGITLVLRPGYNHQLLEKLLAAQLISSTVLSQA